MFNVWIEICVLSAPIYEEIHGFHRFEKTSIVPNCIVFIQHTISLFHDWKSLVTRIGAQNMLLLLPLFVKVKKAMYLYAYNIYIVYVTNNENS